MNNISAISQNRIMMVSQKALFILLLASIAPVIQARTYMTTEDFIQQSYKIAPQPQAIWITGDLKRSAYDILGHFYNGLRIKYWYKEGQSTWVLDEVGKERPITVGITIKEGVVVSVKVLSYRETRGSEVRHAFFLNQFIGATRQKDHSLSHNIDGITGATLSVRALTKLTQLALLLHQKVSTDEI